LFQIYSDTSISPAAGLPQQNYNSDVPASDMNFPVFLPQKLELGGPFEKFVDWRQYGAFMQSEAVIVMPSCRGGGNVVVA
jgi:hypothetical protein